MKGLLRLVVLLILVVSVTACVQVAPAPAPADSSSGDTAAPADDLLAEIMERGTIRISTDPNYEPQSFLNADGEFVGFDVDVAKEIASRLGVIGTWDVVRAQAPTNPAVIEVKQGDTMFTILPTLYKARLAAGSPTLSVCPPISIRIWG